VAERRGLVALMGHFPSHPRAAPFPQDKEYSTHSVQHRRVIHLLGWLYEFFTLSLIKVVFSARMFHLNFHHVMRGSTTHNRFMLT